MIKRFIPNYFHMLALVLCFISISANASVHPRSAEEEPPNVIFIVGDDMKLNHFGFINGRAYTPNLTRLANDGAYFSRAYAPSAACTPTRFSCLTGRFASRCQSPSFINSASTEGIYAVGWNTDLEHEPDILPKVLQKAGYTTGIVGKWHNGTPDNYGKLEQAFSFLDDPADPEVAKELREMDQLLKQHLNYLGFDYVESIVKNNYGGHPLKALRYHNQEAITQAAITFIDQNRERPFFLYMPTTLMHGPSPRKSLDANPRKTYGGLLTEPLLVQPSRASVISRAKAHKIPENNVAVTWLDDGIGEVLKALKKRDLEKKTLIIFFNDHGVDGGKASCYESGVRSPAMIYWPGKIKLAHSEALVQNTDFYPTILELCGVKFDKTKHDGKSLWSILSGKTTKVRDAVFCEFGYTRAVVTDEWKYLAFRIPPSKQLNQAQRKKIAERLMRQKEKGHRSKYIPKPDAPLSHMGIPGGQNTERSNALKHYSKHYHDPDQLYNLKNDPGEQKNLASDSRYADELENMKKLLTKYVDDLPGTFGEF